MVALLLAAALATPSGGYALGRTGGNIRPFTVTISAAGRVRVSGPVHVRRTELSRTQLASLARVAADVRFTTLPRATRCPGTLPDVAETFVRVGTRTATVHGDCVDRYTRLWNALAAAIGLTF